MHFGVLEKIPLRQGERKEKRLGVTDLDNINTIYYVFTFKNFGRKML
jgi:hypothetical protein